MLCPNCGSPRVSTETVVHGHQTMGAARSFNEGNVIGGVLKLMWLLVSKVTLAEMRCRECPLPFKAFQSGSIKLLWGYALAAGFIGLVTGPIPGTSFLLFCLEILMVISMGRANRQKVHIAEVGCVMIVIILVVQLLKTAVVELLWLLPVLGYGAQAIIGFSFVFLLGLMLDSYYTVKAGRAA